MMAGEKPWIPAVAAAFIVFCCCLWSPGQQVPKERLTPLSEIPVALKGDPIGDLLRKWYADGTAAGNMGDYYDNRDSGHSLLPLAPYPQLQKITYSEEQIRARQNWGLQRRILPAVVFGNSSTSMTPEQGGSNTRNYYTDPRGLEFLSRQYVANNLYIYPEHRDHDPGRNGIGGYGDLFPTNTPYLITSQGSSGSDLPFMQAMPYVLAAFRPEVKRKLVQSGLLMPTIQMILRITGSHLSGPGDYLTGKAHPSVFEGGNVNKRAMVDMAHGMTPENLPPIALLRVVKEDVPFPGIDYFDPGRTEKLADTPAVVARIVRGSAFLRRIVVSAENSRDINRRPLKFHWAVLRGDAQKIKIEYLNPSRSVAEITIPYHARTAVAGKPGLESSRVDIGVFVHNGVYYSPPAFVTFFALDSEARTYRRDGQPLEIGYGAGTCTVSVADWNALFDALAPDADSRPGNLLRTMFKAEEIKAIRESGEEYRQHAAARRAAQQTIDGNKKDEASLAEARRILEMAKRAEAQALQKPIHPLKSGAAEAVQSALNAMLRDSDLWSAHAREIEWIYPSTDSRSRDALDGVRNKLLALGLAENVNGAFRLKLLRGVAPGGAPTRYERGMMERLNGTLMSSMLFPGIVASEWREDYVDNRIATPREWRDVYRYSPDGTPLGWRRYQAGGMVEFNAEGMLIIDKDAQGRCVRAREVRYELEPRKKGTDSLPAKVRMVPADSIREYVYEGTNDWKGRTKQR